MLHSCADFPLTRKQELVPLPDKEWDEPIKRKDDLEEKREIVLSNGQKVARSLGCFLPLTRRTASTLNLR
jgi:hypothetical protein